MTAHSSGPEQLLYLFFVVVILLHHTARYWNLIPVGSVMRLRYHKWHWIIQMAVWIKFEFADGDTLSKFRCSNASGTNESHYKCIFYCRWYAIFWYATSSCIGQLTDASSHWIYSWGRRARIVATPKSHKHITNLQKIELLWIYARIWRNEHFWIWVNWPWKQCSQKRPTTQLKMYAFLETLHGWRPLTNNGRIQADRLLHHRNIFTFKCTQFIHNRREYFISMCTKHPHIIHIIHLPFCNRKFWFHRISYQECAKNRIKKKLHRVSVWKHSFIEFYHTIDMASRFRHAKLRLIAALHLFHNNYE